MSSKKKNQTGLKQKTLFGWVRLEKSPNDNENTDEIINDEVANFAATCSVRMVESQAFNSSARDTSPAERGVEVLPAFS